MCFVSADVDLVLVVHSQWQWWACCSLIWKTLDSRTKYISASGNAHIHYNLHFGDGVVCWQKQASSICQRLRGPPTPFDSAANHVVVDCWHQRWLQVVCNLFLRWRCNINSWLLASVAIASSLPAPSFHSLAMLSRQRQSSCCACCPPRWVWQSSSVVSTSMVQPHCHRRAANCCGIVEATSCFSRQSRDPLDVEARSTLNKVANWQMWLLHWKQLVEATNEGWSTEKQYIICLYICRQGTSKTQKISVHIKALMGC